MTSLASIRERQRSIRLAHLREGDWDGFSDVDLLAVAPTQAEASQLADALVSAGLGDDVIALSKSRWQQLQASGDPYWAAIRSDAMPLQPR